MCIKSFLSYKDELLWCFVKIYFMKMEYILSLFAFHFFVCLIFFTSFPSEVKWRNQSKIHQDLPKPAYSAPLSGMWRCV